MLLVFPSFAIHSGAYRRTALRTEIYPRHARSRLFRMQARSCNRRQHKFVVRIPECEQRKSVRDDCCRDQAGGETKMRRTNERPLELMKTLNM